MTVPFEDTEYAIHNHLKGQQLATKPLFGIQVNYPGWAWDTDDLDQWIVPNVEDDQEGQVRKKLGVGIFTAILQVRLTKNEPQARAKLASNVKEAFRLTDGSGKRLHLAVMDKHSGDGNTQLGILRFSHGRVTQEPFPEKGIYTAYVNIPYLISEGS
jgi:hypothetical protein